MPMHLNLMKMGCTLRLWFCKLDEDKLYFLKILSDSWPCAVPFLALNWRLCCLCFCGGKECKKCVEIFFFIAKCTYGKAK